MDMITSQLNSENIGAIAGLLGENSDLVGKAMSGAAPALLGGLLSSFSKPEGKKAFEQSLNEADDGILGNLAGALGGSGGSSLIATGSKMLGSMLGGGKTSMLESALSSFSGLSAGSTKMLLGVATPMLMGMLKKKSKSDGLSIGGLMDMLIGQKDNISKAMPAALSSSLSGGGFLDGLTGKATAATAATAAAAASTAGVSKQAANEGSSLMKKLLPLIILAALAWLAYQFFLKPSTAPVTTTGTQAVTSQAVTSITDEFGPLLGRSVDALASINSVESARAALPQLQGIDQSLASIVEAASGLSPAQSKKLADTAARLMPDLQSAATRATAIPGVGDVIGSSLDSIMRKVAALAG
jgi:hypothetical protein